MRAIEAIDSELRLVATLRRAARERGGPLPSIDVADALLDERRGLAEWATTRPRDSDSTGLVTLPMMMGTLRH
ncbi:MAG TPA: hypothetical protein VMQ38_00240 [Mycobacterium sp.]|jgi:hypothetical protein|nr:hypothetical protein [Mycobacterium sp.]